MEEHKVNIANDNIYNVDKLMCVGVWFDFFRDLFQCQNPWYMGGKLDNKERGSNGEPLLYMVSWYKRRSDIMEFRLLNPSTIHNWDVLATWFDVLSI